MLVVPAASFDCDLVDSLTTLPDAIRSRLFCPEYTAEEQRWIDEVRMLGVEEQVAAAKARLEARFGVPLRIDASQVSEAIQFLRTTGYVSGASYLLREHGHCFSNTARARIRESFGT